VRAQHGCCVLAPKLGDVTALSGKQSAVNGEPLPSLETLCVREITVHSPPPPTFGDSKELAHRGLC
jgi:hypothetical protein